jgi:hypothetical protein
MQMTRHIRKIGLVLILKRQDRTAKPRYLAGVVNACECCDPHVYSGVVSTTSLQDLCNVNSIGN